MFLDPDWSQAVTKEASLGGVAVGLVAVVGRRLEAIIYQLGSVADIFAVEALEVDAVGIG